MLTNCFGFDLIAVGGKKIPNILIKLIKSK